MYFSPNNLVSISNFYDAQAQAGSVQCSACTSAFPSLRCQQTKSVSVSSVLSRVQTVPSGVQPQSRFCPESRGSARSEDNGDNSAVALQEAAAAVSPG